MSSPHSLSSLRRKRLSERAMVWFAQALVGCFRVIFHGLELVSPKEKRSRLRQFREKMDALTQERDVILGQIQSRDPHGGILSLEERLGPHVAPEDRAGLQDIVSEVRAMREEGETLRRIRADADGDEALAVAGYRDYVLAHPDSDAGYSWLGGALRKAGDLDGSLAAYREVIRLAGGDSIPGNSARLHRGMVLEQKGDTEAAVAEFQWIIDNASPSTELYVALAYLSLGGVLNAKGNRREARAVWKQAIKWDPTKVVAKQARELLNANL